MGMGCCHGCGEGAYCRLIPENAFERSGGDVGGGGTGGGEETDRRFSISNFAARSFLSFALFVTNFVACW